MTTEETESFLGDEREYLSPAEDISDVIQVLKIVTGPLHKAVLDRHESTILSEGEVFTTAELMAAAAKYADMTSLNSFLPHSSGSWRTSRPAKIRLRLTPTGRFMATSSPARAVRFVRSSVQRSWSISAATPSSQWEENARVYE